MKRTRPHYPPEDIATKLHQMGVLVGQGLLVTEAVRRVGMSDSTYYRWRAGRRVQLEQARPDPDQARLVQRLETENTRLRRAVAELVIEKQALKDEAPGCN